MGRLRSSIQRLLSLFGRSGAESALNDEINSHLDAHIDDNIRSGLPAREAKRRARLALYGAERTKELVRDRRGFPRLDSLVQDIRHGTRTLLHAPAFSVAAVLIL